MLKLQRKKLILLLSHITRKISIPINGVIGVTNSDLSYKFVVGTWSLVVVVSSTLK